MAIFLPRPFVFNVIRPVAALVLVALVATTAYSGTVKASADTLPGDFLYPAKRTAERAQGAVISLVGDEKSETEYHVDLAQRRAAEAKEIINTKKNDPKKSEKVAVAVNDLQKELKSINEKLENTKDGEKLEANVAREVKKDTEAINEMLQGVKVELTLSTSTIDRALALQVSETKNLVQDVSVRAVEIMVEKHLEGDNSISKEDVEQAIDATITRAANSVLESTQTVVGAQTILESVTSQVKDLQKDSIKDNAELVTSTKEFTDKLINVASSTKEAAIRTQEATAMVDQKIIETRELVGSGDLSQAMSKLREVTTASREATKISDEMIEQAQTVLPIVQGIKIINTPAVSTSTAQVSTTEIVSLITSSTPAAPTSTTSTTNTSTAVMASSTVSSTKER